MCYESANYKPSKIEDNFFSVLAVMLQKTINIKMVSCCHRQEINQLTGQQWSFAKRTSFIIQHFS